MLEGLAAVVVKDMADRARATRDARDRMIEGVRDAAFGEPSPMRGIHDPSAALGLDVLPESDPHFAALKDALSALPESARRELWALVLIGRGDYGVKDWDRAMAESNRLTEVGPALFLEQAELHEHLTKALYEIEHG